MDENLDINIIDIDVFLSNELKENINSFERNKENIEICKSVKINKLGGKLATDINSVIRNFEDKIFSELHYILYKQKTEQLLKRFIKLMRIPIKSKTDNYEFKKEKRTIVNDYMNLVKIYVNRNILDKLRISDERHIDLSITYCDNCENTSEFIKDDDVLICNVCYSEIIKMAYFNNRSYSISVTKCNYDRMTHFKDCLKQYQGKQNTFINPEVYQNIEQSLITLGFLSENTDKNVDKLERFKNVTKTHISYILKKLGYTKHYDDYILIHATLTGQKPADISDIEDKLLKDFEDISEQYSLLTNINRKNFINIQYILYVLLLRYDHKFEKEDFINAKSLKRKMEKDKICREIFKKLGWEFKNS